MYHTVGWIHTDLARLAALIAGPRRPSTLTHSHSLIYAFSYFFFRLLSRRDKSIISAKLAKLVSRTNYLKRKPPRAIIWSLKRSHHRLTLPSLHLSGTRSIILCIRNLIRFWFCFRNVPFWSTPQVEWPHMACTKKPYGEGKNNIGYLITQRMNAKTSPRPFLLVYFLRRGVH
jgi:hypothetical protein